MGLNSLIYPFKWCLALVPILPHPLIEMIEAPLPILVGISRREYKDLNLTQDEKDSKIWVFLDHGGEVIWNKDSRSLPVFDLSSRCIELELEYAKFQTTYESLVDAITVRNTKLQNSHNNELESSQLQNDELKNSCLIICKLIRTLIKENILNLIKKVNLVEAQDSDFQNFVEVKLYKLIYNRSLGGK